MLLCATNLRHAMINHYQISCVLNMTTKISILRALNIYVFLLICLFFHVWHLIFRVTEMCYILTLTVRGSTLIVRI